MDSTFWLWLPIAALYVATLVGLMVYGFHCYAMIGLFMLRQRHHRELAQAEAEAYNARRRDDDYPAVTIQLPVFNERAVVERLLRSLEGLDYPRDRLDVQVLDDSTDDSRDLIDRVAAELRERGLDIRVLRRDHRHGFKAGALAAGMARARGEYIAIFDADFVVPRDFLRRSVALLDPHPDVACVQARWGHLNQRENWLTRAQSVGIDGHFMAEQGARGYSGYCLNFNGTAGIWRKAAIEAAGGWQGDTLTEDLDLSYRAQLAGFRLRYDLDLECPAEIPNNVLAFKSQQRRWAKGSIETARKLLPRIWASPRFSLAQKIEAALHLTHYVVSVLMCAICLLTLPMLLWTPLPRLGWAISLLWSAIIVSAMAPCVMYTGSGIALGRGIFALTHFPSMLVVGTGICLNNAKAVIEALLGRRSEFVRTPKTGSAGGRGRRLAYAVERNLGLGLVELLLGAYCWYTLYIYIGAQKYLFGFFLIAYALGFTVFGLVTLRQRRRS